MQLFTLLFIVYSLLFISQKNIRNSETAFVKFLLQAIKQRAASFSFHYFEQIIIKIKTIPSMPCNKRQSNSHNSFHQSYIKQYIGIISVLIAPHSPHNHQTPSHFLSSTSCSHLPFPISSPNFPTNPTSPQVFQASKYKKSSDVRCCIINICCCMSELIKKHRRNRAEEASQECFRQSVPYAPLQTTRKSMGLTYQSPKIFRSSDTANLQLRESFTHKYNRHHHLPNPEMPNNKEPSALISTLQELQLKLKNAKKFLQNKPSAQDLFSLHLSRVLQKNPQQIQSDNFWEKLQESTINLESQKKLTCVLKSKEKIVWASKVKQYYLSQLAKGIAGINERAMEHLEISLEVLKSCKEHQLPDETVIPRNKVFLPQEEKYFGKKVLIIDLDETLFHCDFQRNSEDDLEVEISNEGEKGYISIRPYALSFLKRAAQHFQIISFTASERSYADAILDQLDFQHKLIQHRLYRQHCVRLQENVYAKDISIINRPLSHMVLVDNSPISYLYQRDNGIPILPYLSGEDSQLLSLEKYLEHVRKQIDVRAINRRTFKLSRYQQFQSSEELVHELYQQRNYY